MINILSQELKRPLKRNCKIFVSVLIVSNFKVAKGLNEGKSLERRIVTVTHDSWTTEKANTVGSSFRNRVKVILLLFPFLKFSTSCKKSVC